MSHLPFGPWGRLSIVDDFFHDDARAKLRFLRLRHCEDGASCRRRRPEIAKKVCHAMGASVRDPRIRQREAEKDLREQRELTRFAGYTRDMPRIVGPRSDLIDKDLETVRGV